MIETFQTIRTTRWLTVLFAMLSVFGTIYLVVGTTMFLLGGISASWAVVSFGVAFWSLAVGILCFFGLRK